VADRKSSKEIYFLGSFGQAAGSFNNFWKVSLNGTNTNDVNAHPPSKKVTFKENIMAENSSSEMN
jgi:hypothetical protein